MNKTITPSFYRCLLLIFAVLFISACADDDNLDQPAELVPFYTKHYLDVNWHASTGAGAEEPGAGRQRTRSRHLPEIALP